MKHVKGDFIAGWFKHEKSKFNFNNQLKLAKLWTNICTDAEEYEMSSALQVEIKKIIAERLAERKKKRDWKQKANYFINKIARKFRFL